MPALSPRARPADGDRAFGFSKGQQGRRQGRRASRVDPDRGEVTALTKNDLINAVAAHGLSKRQSASVVESLFDIIFRCFEKGEDVKIVGFGHFRIRRKASRRGRNPQTGDSIEITARKVLTFKPSKGLKIRINHHAQ
jgi:integration host factor subunit alpha